MKLLEQIMLNVSLPFERCGFSFLIGKGKTLKKGGMYEDPNGVSRCICAKALKKLRECEEKLVKDQFDGLDVYVAENAGLNFMFCRKPCVLWRAFVRMSHYLRREDTYVCEFRVSLPKTEAGIRGLLMMKQVYEAFKEEYGCLKEASARLMV